MHLFFLGFSQIYFILFISKYFDYIYLPYYTILLIVIGQLISLFAIKNNSKLFLKDYLSDILLTVSFLLFSFVPYRFPIFLQISSFIILSTLIILSYQGRVVSLLSEKNTNFFLNYFKELSGAAVGALYWGYLSDIVGFKGFCLTLVILNLFTGVNKRIGLVLKLCSIVIIYFFLQEPQPLINKRNRQVSISHGEIIQKIWDINGVVELVDLTKLKSSMVFLFDGGEIKSQSTKIESSMDWGKIKKMILSGQPFGLSGVDVALPYINRADKLRSTFLISCVGGQELIAAKAFGSKKNIVVDINKSALNLSQFFLSEYNNDLFQDASTIHADGRNYLETVSTKFDVIQIYNAHTAAFYGLLGAGTQPTSLTTAEALVEYFNKLNPMGILHIGQPFSEKLFSTLSYASSRMQNFAIERQLIIIYRESAAGGVYNFYIKKGDWTTEDLVQIDEVLSKDVDSKYSINYFPVGIKTENLKLRIPIEKIDHKITLRPATDDWPFFNYQLNEIKHLGFLYIMLVGTSLFLFWIFRTLVFTDSDVHLDAFNVGIQFAVSQLFMIFCFQKLIGLPGQGLSWALFSSFLISAIGSLLQMKIDKVFLNEYFGLLILFALAGIWIYLPNVPILIILNGLILFLMNQKFIKLCRLENSYLNKLWFWNGFGYFTGNIIFYLIWTYFGMSYVLITSFLIYMLFAGLSSRFRHI